MPNLKVQRMIIKLKEWERKCPAYTWRQGENMSRMTMASLIGASYMTMREYEAGRSVPTTHLLVAMSELMGRKPEDLKIAWEAWLGERPGVAKRPARDTDGAPEKEISE